MEKVSKAPAQDFTLGLVILDETVDLAPERVDGELAAAGQPA